MALFESDNPTLSEKIFSKTLNPADSQTMTVRGTMAKFGFLLAMVLAGAIYTWNLYYRLQEDTMRTVFWIGLIGGLITGLVITFKPNLARYLAPAYGILEGFVVGGLSAIVNDMVKGKYQGIVMQAVVLTFGVAIAVFLLYNFRIIKPTQKFKTVMLVSSVGILLLYIVSFILAAFKVSIPFMSWTDSSLLGIGINIFVIVIAALTLILDFERIEVGAAMGAPKHMEWYGAFGLLVTLVWLYIQILKLLSRFANNRN